MFDVLLQYVCGNVVCEEKSLCDVEMAVMMLVVIITIVRLCLIRHSQPST